MHTRKEGKTAVCELCRKNTKQRENNYVKATETTCAERAFLSETEKLHSALDKKCQSCVYSLKKRIYLAIIPTMRAREDSYDMKKQLRFLIADAGDSLAGLLSDMLRRQGVWTVMCRQLRSDLMQAVRTEHSDVLVLNLTYPTLDFPTVIQDILNLTDIKVLILYRQKNLYYEALSTQNQYYCWRIPPEPDELYRAVCREFLHTEYTRGQPEKKEDNPFFEIDNLLCSACVPTNRIGFTYLRYGILKAMEYPDLPISMQKLYQEIMKRYGVNYSRVEHAIRMAIQAAWHRACEPPFSWLDLPISRTRKPTNLEFISAAAEMLLRTRHSKTDTLSDSVLSWG